LKLDWSNRKKRDALYAEVDKLLFLAEDIKRWVGQPESQPIAQAAVTQVASPEEAEFDYDTALAALLDTMTPAT